MYRLYVTENGAAGNDSIIDGEVNDEQRVRYFQTHLEAVDNAIRAGVRVDGYFCLEFNGQLRMGIWL